MSGEIEQKQFAYQHKLSAAGWAGSLWIKVRFFGKNTSGATAVEYGLLAGLVAIGLAGGLGALADLVSLLFDTIGDEAAEVSNAMAEGG